MKLAIGSDHVGLSLKLHIIKYLEEKGFRLKDMGAYNEERTDYPIYSKLVAEAVAAGEFDAGILICGTGAGISIAANKVAGIRAVVCSEPYTAKLAREHNNANILALGARVVGPALAEMIVDAFLSAPFEGGRHQGRIDMISRMEQGGR